MTGEHSLSLHLDRRRMKNDGTFPVKLRLYIPRQRKQKYYHTGYAFTPEDFQFLTGSEPLEKPEEQVRHKLQQLLRQARYLAGLTKPFDLSRFEMQLQNDPGPDTLVYRLFSDKIMELKAAKQLSTAQSYAYTIKSMVAFEQFCGNDGKALTVYDIDPGWLQGYHNYMVNEAGNSLSTTGIYLRNLRHILNRSVESGQLDRKRYPFGKGKFVITAVPGVKKTLSRSQVSSICMAGSLTPEQVKARDFWLLSYWCKGITMKEIALLKYEHIRGDVIHFRERRTGNDGAQKEPVRFYLNDQVNAILLKYGNAHQFPHNYIFPILDLHDTEEQIFEKIKRFTRFVNQHMKKLVAKTDTDISTQISTNWARQSYLSHSVGVSG